MSKQEQLRDDVFQMDYTIRMSRNFSFTREQLRAFRVFIYRAARRGADLNECSIGDWARRFQAAG